MVDNLNSCGDTHWIIFDCSRGWLSDLANTLRPRHSGRHFTDAIFKFIFLNENCCIWIKNSLKGPIDNKPSLVQIMTWHLTSDKPSSEPPVAKFTDAYMLHSVSMGWVAENCRRQMHDVQGHRKPCHDHCLFNTLRRARNGPTFGDIAKMRYIQTACHFIEGACNDWVGLVVAHDDVIKWKHFLRYWPFLRGIRRSQVNSLHKGQWRGASMFSLICAWTNSWANNGDAGDLRRHHAHYDVIVMRYPLWHQASISSPSAKLVLLWMSLFNAHTLKRKCCHFDEILITDCTESCHFDNFRCSQWWKFRQNDDISVSVYDTYASINNAIIGSDNDSACSASSYYRIQCRLIVNCTPAKKFQWNLNQIGQSSHNIYLAAGYFVAMY